MPVKTRLQTFVRTSSFFLEAYLTAISYLFLGPRSIFFDSWFSPFCFFLHFAVPASAFLLFLLLRFLIFLLLLLLLLCFSPSLLSCLSLVSFSALPRFALPASHSLLLCLSALRLSTCAFLFFSHVFLLLYFFLLLSSLLTSFLCRLFGFIFVLLCSLLFASLMKPR